MTAKANFANRRAGWGKTPPTTPKPKKPALKICEKCRHINIPSALECVKCTQPLRKPSKYGNKKTIVDGIEFGSQKEARRWQQLRLLERAGDIVELERQVVFELAPSVQYAGKRATPALRYVADFCYFEQRAPGIFGVKLDGKPVIWHYTVEDCKGMRTPVYKIKRHLMLAVHKIEVRET